MMLKRVTKLAQDFACDESGATAVEYGLIAALVSLSVVLAATAIGTRIGNFFLSLGNWFGGVSVS